MSEIKQNIALNNMRHSAAHLTAHAVAELFPNTLLTIGPVTDEGFFYDFLPEQNFKEEDLPLIEAKMREIVARNLPITQREISKKEAEKLFANNPFKLELIRNIPGDTVGLSQQGDFFDLCKVVLTGDPYQIDSPYLDFSSNGLVVASERFKGQRLFGTVYLESSERSELSELASKLL